MPMNSNFTKDLEQLESYSLQLIDLFSNLPDSYFDDPMLQPPAKIVDSLMSYAAKGKSIKEPDKLFRYTVN